MPEASIWWNSTVGLVQGISEREKSARLGVAAVVRAKIDWFVRAGLPLADRVEVHCQLVAGSRFVEGEQMTAMAQDTDKRAVFEWPGVAARTDEPRVDRYRMREAAVNCAAGALLGHEAAGSDEAVTVAGLPVVEIHGVDHAVAVHRIGVVDRLETWIGSVAHISATEVPRYSA